MLNEEIDENEILSDFEKGNFKSVMTSDVHLRMIEAAKLTIQKDQRKLRRFSDQDIFKSFVRRFKMILKG